MTLDLVMIFFVNDTKGTGNKRKNSHVGLNKNVKFHYPQNKEATHRMGKIQDTNAKVIMSLRSSLSNHL